MTGCRGASCISHLFFVDKSIIFTRAMKNECLVIADMISTNKSVSGQKVNMQKSEMEFSNNVLVEIRNELLQVFPM